MHALVMLTAADDPSGGAVPLAAIGGAVTAAGGRVTGVYGVRVLVAHADRLILEALQRRYAGVRVFATHVPENATHHLDQDGLTAIAAWNAWTTTPRGPRGGAGPLPPDLARA